MPGVTDNFAIPFPCEQELTSNVFQAYATGAEAALSTVAADATSATSPPAVGLQFSSGTVAATGVTTAISYGVINWDTVGMFTLASPTIVTIQRAGTYLVTSNTTGNLTGNITPIRYAVLRGGTEVAYRESQNTGAIIPSSMFSVSVLMPFMTVGEQITTNVLYTGAQPTLSFFGRLTVTRVALP
jgi:hypothetical protein